MKIDLIGLIITSSIPKFCYDGLIIDDDAVELDAVHSLDYMIMEYARVRNGGTSDTVAIPSIFTSTAK